MWGKRLSPPGVPRGAAGVWVPPWCSLSLEGALRDLPGAAVGGQGGLEASGELQVDRATQEPPRAGCSAAHVVQRAGYSQKLRKIN